jgi:hypothetical protein
MSNGNRKIDRLGLFFVVGFFVVGPKRFLFETVAISGSYSSGTWL